MHDNSKSFRENILPHASIGEIEAEYIKWVKEDKFLIFRRRHILNFHGDWVWRYIASFASKRGNSRYAFRVRSKFNRLCMLAINSGKSAVNEFENTASNVLFITLTYDINRSSLQSAWENIGVELNGLLS